MQKLFTRSMPRAADNLSARAVKRCKTL